MSSDLVAKRYVQALYELACEKNEQENTGVQLEEFKDLFDSSEELQRALTSPTIDSQNKIELISVILQKMELSVLCSNFIKVIIKRNRIENLDSMVEEYSRLERERKNIVRIQVTTAKPMRQSAQEDLKRKLEESLHSEVELIAADDCSLIGGIVARIGGTIYDGSIDHQLSIIQHRIEEE